MRFLFWFSVILSGLITIAGFVLTNISTFPFHPTGEMYVGGNGNIGLMFIVFPSLIILYFFFAMLFIFEKIHEHYKVNKKYFLLGYSSILVMLISISIYRIVTFHAKIRPYFDYEIGYLNPFSNNLYFNTWTFLA